MQFSHLLDTLLGEISPIEKMQLRFSTSFSFSDTNSSAYITYFVLGTGESDSEISTLPNIYVIGGSLADTTSNSSIVGRIAGAGNAEYSSTHYWLAQSLNSVYFRTSFSITDWVLNGTNYELVIQHGLGSVNLVIEVWDGETAVTGGLIVKTVDSNTVKIIVNDNFRFNGKIIIGVF